MKFALEEHARLNTPEDGKRWLSLTPMIRSAVVERLRRLDQRARAWADRGDRPLRSEGIRNNVYLTTSGCFSGEPLRCAIEAVGADRVMFSVDDPFRVDARGWELVRRGAARPGHT